MQKPLTVPTGEQLLGRVIDALGRPLDDGPPLLGAERRVHFGAPAALAREPIREPFATGIAAIDGFLQERGPLAR